MDIKEIEKIYPRIPIGRAQDLTDQTFGKWKVLYRTQNQKNISMWVCECQCEAHTIKPVSTKSLNAGTSTNCGCKRKETIHNRTDKLIHQRDENNNIILKKCSRCNEWKQLSEFWKNTTCKDGYHNECKSCYRSAKENRYTLYKKSAKARNFTFELEKEEFYFLLSQACKYCGDTENIGIDRIDSNEGYIISNCVPCCTKCNRMKLNYTIDDFLCHIKKIYEHNNL